jgi:hypothetical protein
MVSPGAESEGASTQAITALVVGILGLVPCFGFLLGPIAWFLGNQEIASIRQGRTPAAGERLARAARILGIIGTALLAALLLWLLAFGGIAALSRLLHRP